MRVWIWLATMALNPAERRTNHQMIQIDDELCDTSAKE
jgi:hypothetical protein